MKNEDILCIVQELPLFVSLKLKRYEQENSASLSNHTNSNENNNHLITPGHVTPNNQNNDVKFYFII